MGVRCVIFFKAVRINPSKMITSFYSLAVLVPWPHRWHLHLHQTSDLYRGNQPQDHRLNRCNEQSTDQLLDYARAAERLLKKLLGAVAIIPFPCPDLSSVYDFYADTFLCFRLYAGQWQP